MKIIDTFSNRLKKALKYSNMRQVDLVEKTNLDKTLINKYLAGLMKAKQDKLTILADALNVNEIWLMGYDVPMERNLNSLNNIKNNIIKVPILGTVKAGYDYLAEENIVGYITDYSASDSENYYAVYVHGDSMEPIMRDGDIVIVHKQEDFESGNTCIVLINGEEATVKKVVVVDDGIDLIAANPYFPNRHFSKDEMKTLPVKIIGRVRESRKRNAFN